MLKIFLYSNYIINALDLIELRWVYSKHTYI